MYEREAEMVGWGEGEREGEEMWGCGDVGI